MKESVACVKVSPGAPFPSSLPTIQLPPSLELLVLHLKLFVPGGGGRLWGEVRNRGDSPSPQPSFIRLLVAAAAVSAFPQGKEPRGLVLRGQLGGVDGGFKFKMKGHANQMDL